MRLGPGPAAAGVDVGGTDLKAVLVDRSGTVIARATVSTPAAGPESGRQVVELVGRLCERFADQHPSVRPEAVGLVVPGIVREADGVGVASENIGWQNMPFRDAAAARLGAPVAFGHDLRAAGLAEQRLGAAAGFKDAVVVAIGTGVAAAVFIDGKPHSGRGFAGEIGHVKVADGPVCACGGLGHLEAVASAAAIARRYNALTGSAVRGAREVVDRMLAGDKAASEVWDSALDSLAIGLSHVVGLLAPEVIVLGGGLANAGDALVRPLEQRLNALLTFQPRPQLLLTRIGPDAGAIGAALLARDLVAATSRTSAP